MDNDDDNCLSSAIDSARFDIINGPLIPTQSTNLATLSTPSISNNILHTSTEATTKEHGNSSDHKNARGSFANSNADFYLSVDNFSNFADIA